MSIRISFHEEGSGFQGRVFGIDSRGDYSRYRGALVKLEVNRSHKVKPPKGYDERHADPTTPWTCKYVVSITAKILLEQGWIDILGVNRIVTVVVAPADLYDQKYKESQEYGQMEDVCIETARMMVVSRVLEWLNA